MLKHNKANTKQDDRKHQTKWRETLAIPLKSGTRQSCVGLSVGVWVASQGPHFVPGENWVL